MNLVAELRRRNVFKVGVTYAIVAWLLVQVVVSVKTPLQLPAWADTLTIILLAVGFPVALVLAWAFDLTPQGIRRSTDAPEQESAAPALQAPAPQPAAAAGPVAEQSIAVLPFVNMSSDPEQEYFSDGISEELIDQLVKIRGLHVVGRTSSFFFKNKNEDLRTIGEKLGVAHVLEGSVRKAGNRIRITAQLIKVSNGYHLWSESYDRELADIFDVQEQTARSVAEALRVTLGVATELGRGGTRNVAAYDGLLAARAAYRQAGRVDILRAIALLEHVVELDPAFGEAWGELAELCYSVSGVYLADRAQEMRAKSRAAAARAIALVPDSITALRVRAQLELADYNWLSAAAHFEHALRQAPNDSATNLEYALLECCVGAARRAEGLARCGVASDPLSLFAAIQLVVACELGDLEASSRECDRASDLLGGPRALQGPRLAIAMTRRDRAQMDALIQHNEILREHILPGDGLPLTRIMHERLDRPEEAIAELERLAASAAHSSPFVLMVMALWASWFGAQELALRFYYRVSAVRNSVIWMMWRPLHAPMRQLPGFKQLLHDIGLVAYWRETGEWGDFCRPLGADDFECFR